MNRSVLLAAVVLSVGLPAFGQEPIELKIATVAPEGSTWMKVFREADDELRKKTGGAVGFRYYPGGILGDELVVIDKMNEGRVDGSALTGLGFGRILPEARILELPLFFRSYAEYDAVAREFEKIFAERLAARGWKLLGLAEGGFANFWSRRPIRSLADLRATPVWSREGDPIPRRTFEAFGLEIQESPLSEVLERLKSGRTETIYSSPISLLAFQWFPHVRYRVDLDLFNLQAAYLVRAESFERIPARHRDDVERIAAKHVARLVERARADNREALALLEKRGIETVTLDPASRAELQARADRLAESLAGDLYDRELYDTLRKLRGR